MQADFGLSDTSFFRVNPAKHARQIGFDTELDGVADDVPIILAFESATGEKWLIHGRTEARLN